VSEWSFGLIRFDLFVSDISPCMCFSNSIHFLFLPIPSTDAAAVPLLASEAHPISAAKLKKEKAAWKITRVKGQHLEGVMIPTIEDTVHPEEGGGEGSVGPDESSFDRDEDGANDAGETKPLMNGKSKPVYTA